MTAITPEIPPKRLAAAGGGTEGFGAVLDRLTQESGTVETGHGGKSIAEAAKQFEALMFGQILKAMQPDSEGAFGGGDGANSTMMQLAQEHLATAMTAGGGLGLARMIETQLAAREQSAVAIPNGES